MTYRGLDVDLAGGEHLRLPGRVLGKRKLYGCLGRGRGGVLGTHLRCHRSVVVHQVRIERQAREAESVRRRRVRQAPARGLGCGMRARAREGAASGPAALHRLRCARLLGNVLQVKLGSVPQCFSHPRARGGGRRARRLPVGLLSLVCLFGLVFLWGSTVSCILMLTYLGRYTSCAGSMNPRSWSSCTGRLPGKTGYRPSLPPACRWGCA